MDSSVRSPGTKRRYRKIPSLEHTLSSQESTNHGNQQQAFNNSKSGEDKVRKQFPHPTTSKPAESAQAVPLSGKPYFSSIMTKSQIQSPFQMVIPRSFYSFLPDTCVPAVLCCQNKMWEMRYFGDRELRRFDSGWRNFAVDNNLRIGDGCVLELMDDKVLKFQVRILRGDIPQREIAECGKSLDSPITID